VTSGVETVLRVLEDADFQRLHDPLVIAGATFDFDAAVRGTKWSNDLVVVAAGATPTRRLVQLLSGLSRMLDQVESRRPVTVVLLGAASRGSEVAEIERHARVLLIESPDPDEDEVRHAVSVLLPLTLPSAAARGDEPLNEVARRLGKALSREQIALLDAARDGPDSVRAVLRELIEEAVANEGSS
jgi:hypothetical protein